MKRNPRPPPPRRRTCFIASPSCVKLVLIACAAAALVVVDAQQARATKASTDGDSSSTATGSTTRGPAPGEYVKSRNVTTTNTTTKNNDEQDKERANTTDSVDANPASDVSRDAPPPASAPGARKFTSAGTERIAEDAELAAAAEQIWGDKPVLWFISGNYEPYEYVTGYNDFDESGEMLPPDTPTGFAVEMITRTCDLCGLQCEWVLDDTQNCWSSAGFPGVGLQAGYFDACNAFTKTGRRQLGAAFSDSIARARPAGILTRLDKSGNPVVSPKSDLSDVVVSIVGGWATNGRSIGYATNKCTGWGCVHCCGPVLLVVFISFIDDGF